MTPPPQRPSRRTGQPRPPQSRAPDIGPGTSPMTGEQLGSADRDGFGRLSELLVTGGAELPPMRDETLTDVRLERVFSAAWTAPGCELERCALVGMRLGALEMPEVRWESVTANGGRWGYANLRGSTLRDVVLEDVVIEDLDLMEAEVERLALRDCRIGTLHLSGAQCTDVDLRGASIDRIEGLSGARGIVVDPSQVMIWANDLAQHLGIRVLGEGSGAGN